MNHSKTEICAKRHLTERRFLKHLRAPYWQTEIGIQNCSKSQKLEVDLPATPGRRQRCDFVQCLLGSKSVRDSADRERSGFGLCHTSTSTQSTYSTELHIYSRKITCAEHW